MEKLKPKIEKTEYGCYFILTPIYSSINNTYLSHWQQTSPYYYRIGNLIRYINREYVNNSTKERLIEDCHNIKNET